MNDTVWNSMYSKDAKESKPFGYFDRTMQMKARNPMDLREYMLTYKYLIVIGGVSSADRLNTFLAHSGAVILLQETGFRYHYSAFLKPWVHYGTHDSGTATVVCPFTSDHCHHLVSTLQIVTLSVPTYTVS